MNSQEVISIYESVAVITEAMVGAAREHDWDKLAALESRCASQIQILKNGESSLVLNDDARERKVKIIKQILEDDRQIRSITDPWMEQLAQLIRSAGTERKLNETYGAERAG